MKNNTSPSYLSQVRQLRKVAVSAVKMYPIIALQLKFINHGENTTFKIITQKGNFLLRIHRKNYHSKNAILEELGWIKQLSESGFNIQKPIPSTNGLLVEEITIGDTADTRWCSVLTWVDGKLRYKALTPNIIFNAGLLAAQLHKSALTKKVQYRNYWDNKGLLGANAKFGSLHHLKQEIGKTKYQVIEECREMVFNKIEEYHNKQPHKYTMIHADLHFGNIVWKKNEPIPIDFDDCGYGPQMYDLAVILLATDEFLSLTRKKQKKPFIEAMFEGYLSIQALSKADITILPYFKLARTLVMMGWAFERNDNIHIYTYFNKILDKRITYFNKILKEGLDPLY